MRSGGDTAGATIRTPESARAHDLTLARSAMRTLIVIVNYRTVRIEMSTHDVGGLTERDFSLIAELNEIPTDR